MLRREGDIIIFENTDELLEQADWSVPTVLTPAQAVETGAAMLDDVDRVVRGRLARGEAEALAHDETFHAEQRKIDTLRRGARLIFAACPVEREQFIVEQQVRRQFIR